METTPSPPAPPTPPSPTVSALPTDLRFHTIPYTPDGGFSLNGLLFLLVGLGIAGIVLGVITFYVSKFFYLILLFPMLIGLALGGLGGLLVKKGKVRAPWIAGLTGLLAGILAMLTVHFLDYRQFLDAREADPFLKNVGKQGRDLLVALAPAADREMVKRELAVENFFDYMDYSAHVGVSIKKAGGNDKGMNLGYIGTYIYWAVEALIVAGIVFSMTRKPAHEPFCPLTNEWKVPRCGDNFAVPTEVGIDQTTQALKEGALGQLALFKAQGADAASTTEPLRLYVFASPNHTDQCSLDTRLVKFVPGKQGQVQEMQIAMATYPAEALSSFEKLCS